MDFSRVSFRIMWGFVSPSEQKITAVIQTFYLGDLCGLPSRNDGRTVSHGTQSECEQV